jgi:hypothetical protein
VAGQCGQGRGCCGLVAAGRRNRALVVERGGGLELLDHCRRCFYTTRLSPVHSHSSPWVVSCHHRLRITDPERERHVFLSFLPPTSIVGLFTRWVGTTIEIRKQSIWIVMLRPCSYRPPAIIPTTPRPLRFVSHTGDLLCRYKTEFSLFIAGGPRRTNDDPATHHQQ